MSALLLDLLSSARVYELSHELRAGIPKHPAHPPYLFGLSKKHGDMMRPNDASSASEAITLGGHVGTHIDALCHFSHCGKLHGGVEAEAVQSYAGGVGHLNMTTVAPIFRRGVLADVAGHLGVDCLPASHAVSAAEIEASLGGTPIGAGDVVLVRTGWAKHWPSPRDFYNNNSAPGPDLTAARWLSAFAPFAAGSDTITFEFVPGDEPVHVHLLVERGIHIIECLNLDALARDGVREFVFAALPLRIAGGTGSPIRAVALVS